MLLSACASTPGGAPIRKPAGRVTITILSINDFHGQLDPVIAKTSENPPRRIRLGGARALAATVAQLRQGNPGGTLLLDAGDFMQGSLLSNHFEGAPVRDLFSLLKVDAAAIGNHEFDFGPQGPGLAAAATGVDYQGALKSWAKGAPFPLLSANIRDKGSGRALPWPNVLPNVVLTRKGVRVGIIGLITPATAMTSMQSHVRGLKFMALPVIAAQQARALRRAGAEVIVLLTHAGGACPGREAGTCRGELFSDLLNKLEPGLVDVVVAGHTHRCIWHRFRGVLVSEACARGIAVGRVELVVDRSRGGLDRQASRVLKPELVCHDVFSDTGGCDASRATPESEVVQSPLLVKHQGLVKQAGQMVQRYRGRIQELEQKPLAVLPHPLRHHRYGASGPGLLFARAMLAAVPGADFALINAGAVRADLPQGKITYRHLYQAMPFENHLATVKLSGAKVEELVRKGIAKGRGIFQVAGLRLRARCGPPMALASLDTMDHKPLESKRMYTVVINDYLLAGSDGVGEILGRVPARNKQILRQKVREAIVAFLASGESSLVRALSGSDPLIKILDGPCQPRHLQQRYLCLFNNSCHQ